MKTSSLRHGAQCFDFGHDGFDEGLPAKSWVYGHEQDHVRQV